MLTLLVSIVGARIDTDTARSLQPQARAPERVANDLNGRWLSARPSNQLRNTGLLVHVLDSDPVVLTEHSEITGWLRNMTGAHLWSTVGQNAPYKATGDRYACSIISRRHNQTYHPGISTTLVPMLAPMVFDPRSLPKPVDAGDGSLYYPLFTPTLVLNETALGDRMNCCYPRDGNTDALKCIPLGGNASCTPGCGDGAYRPDQLADMLKEQDRIARENNSRLPTGLVVQKQHLDLTYNEVILDTWSGGGWGKGAQLARFVRAVMIDVRASSFFIRIAREIQAAARAEGVSLPLLAYDQMADAPFTVLSTRDSLTAQAAARKPQLSQGDTQ